MAVIINEFEVVVEPPANAEEEPGTEAVTEEEPPAAMLLSPYDMDSVMRMHYQRLARVRAD